MLTTAAAELIFGILIPYTVVLSRPQYAYFLRYGYILYMKFEVWKLIFLNVMFMLFYDITC